MNKLPLYMLPSLVAASEPGPRDPAPAAEDVSEILKKHMKPGVPYAGISRSAVKRRERAAQRSGKLHTGKPGQVIEMSRGRRYTIAADGSFRLAA